MPLIAALCRSYGLPADIARGRADLFLDKLGFHLVPIAEREFAFAAEAYARFGKGRHPAAASPHG